MQANAGDNDQSRRYRGEGRIVAGRGARNWSSLALVLVAALLLVLCGWLLVHFGRPAIGFDEESGMPQPFSSPSEVPQIEALHAATPEDRSPVAESSDPPAVAEAEIIHPATLIFGSLLDAAYAPIQGAATADLTFIDSTGRLRCSAVREQGDYALHGLGFGTHWVTASAAGYRSLEETIELRPDGPRVRKDFMLQKALELRIKVTTPEGKDLFDVLQKEGAPMGARLLVPVATREDPGERIDAITGSPNDKIGVGQFQSYGPRVQALAPGCMGLLRLDCDLPVWVSLVQHDVVLQTQRVDSEKDVVTFVISPDALRKNLASIRMRIIDARTSLPIERARVMLWGGTHFNPGVATDALGVADIEKREPGRFDLQVSAGGYESHLESIDALPGVLTDLGTVALEREVAVRGRVVDSAGQALAAAFDVGKIDPADRSMHWFRPKGFTSSADGTFDIRGLGPGQYSLRTNNLLAVDEGGWKGIHWVCGNVHLDTRAGPIAGLVLCLRPAAKLVLAVAGGAKSGMRFRIADESGLELVAGSLQGPIPRSLGLPAGSYRVELLGSDGSVLSVRSTTLGASTVKLELQP